MKYKTFEDIEFHYHHDGQHSVITFDNGYGVTVSKDNASSLGGEMGLYQLITINKKLDAIFNTPICKGPIGFLTEEEITEIMIEVQNLPEKDIL